MPNFEGQTAGSRKDDFEKAETSAMEIKKTIMTKVLFPQPGDNLSEEELQGMIAKSKELDEEKKKIIEADHEEALGMEESRNNP